MPNWIQDSGGRLVKRETSHNKELELSLNIMETTPKDQLSHHGHQYNPNEFRSMRDRMHPPHMSTPSCIVPPTEQLIHGSHQCLFSPWFDTWLLVSYFYDGMSSSMKQLLETMCGGDFMSKNPEEAMAFLSYVAEFQEDGMNEKGEVGR
ncbi:hypothetical protein CK203_055401 [Vitis vinifera]|uniref:Uncharacterized protein n=1 Tax=Vitis vinifera TaxID=29760 RepID=A0A438HMU7_VITVI|nr:hypothetical protein CK203_055401 [Vitis vinifera]